MNRIMKPKAVAVIGASAENGKIGNSVMKNLINGGYKGEIYPIHPKADEIMGKKVYKSVKDVPGEIDIAVFAIPASFVAAALTECGEKKNRRRYSDSIRLCRNRQHGGPGGASGDRQKYGIRLMGPNIYGFYYTPANLCANVLHRLRRQGGRGFVVAIRRHRHGDHRLFAFRQDGAYPRSSVSATNPISMRDDLLTFFEQDDNTQIIAQHCEDLKDGPRVRRGRQAGVEEKKTNRGVEGRPHLGRRQGRELAYRRARR